MKKNINTKKGKLAVMGTSFLIGMIIGFFSFIVVVTVVLSLLGY